MSDFIAEVRDAYDIANRARQTARKKVTDKYRGIIEDEVDAEVSALDRAVALSIEKHLKAGVPRAMLRRSLRTNDGDKFRRFMAMVDTDVRDLRRGGTKSKDEPRDPWWGTDDQGRLIIFAHPYTSAPLNRPEVVKRVTWGRGTVFFDVEGGWSVERVKDAFSGKGYASATPTRDDFANAIVLALWEDPNHDVITGTTVEGDPAVYGAEAPVAAVEDDVVDWD